MGNVTKIVKYYGIIGYMKLLFTLAAISDIHIDKYPLESDFFNRVNKKADLLIIGGDINNGKEAEVNHFLDLIYGVKIPIIIIFGNHDCDAGSLEKIKMLLSANPLIRVLDGGYVKFELKGKTLGIAGTKGYGGGFAPHMIISRGEMATKSFVEEEEREIEKLQIALHQMNATTPDFKVVLTHWAAFEETIDGEPKELYVMLGSSRLGDAIETISPHLALNGHAHHGPQGIKKARGKISACNISYKVNEGRMPLFDFFSDGSIVLRHLENH